MLPFVKSRLILPLAFVVGVISDNAVKQMYMTGPGVLKCGVVGDEDRPTIITASFGPAAYYHDCGSWIDWGDGYKSSDYEIVTTQNGSEEQYVFEHVYSQAGTYSISVGVCASSDDFQDDLSFYSNDDMAGYTNWMKLEKPGEGGGEWLLTVSENHGCYDNFGFENNAAKKFLKAKGARDAKIRDLRLFGWLVLDILGVIVLVTLLFRKKQRKQPQEEEFEDAHSSAVATFHRIT
jgi:hypothetical protein